VATVRWSENVLADARKTPHYPGEILCATYSVILSRTVSMIRIYINNIYFNKKVLFGPSGRWLTFQNERYLLVIGNLTIFDICKVKNSYTNIKIICAI
jgi:hypothetical protein